MAYDWLRTEHPIYTACKDAWERNETRYFGDTLVLDELAPFDWENQQRAETATAEDLRRYNNRPISHYERRQRQAVYINFAELFVKQMVGHLFGKAPEEGNGLSFGTLGEVTRTEETDSTPTPAELVYQNTDGIGNDASQWEMFWSRAAEHAHVTGHRWIFVEGPRQAPVTKADEQNGLRPYLVEFSPLSVPNWHFDAGELQFAVIRFRERNPRVEGNSLEGNEGEDSFMLLVAEGYQGLGDEFAGGGWWLFDSDCEMVEESVQVEEGQDPELRPITGTWEETLGRIPMVTYYYERVHSTPMVPAMSRPAVTELLQAAVSYMNLSSAADFDAWDAAQSITFLVGVDKAAYELVRDLVADGSKLVPIPVSKRDGDAPAVVDGSLGAVAAEVFDKRLDRKRLEATELAALEASATPDASGVSKRAGFADLKSPRLALMASEIEGAQTQIIRFLEQRWGTSRGAPAGEVNWPRDYDLLPVIESVREVFELLELSGANSPTLKRKGLIEVAKRKGLVSDTDEQAAIEREIDESIEESRTAANRDRAARGAGEDALDGAVRDALGLGLPGTGGQPAGATPPVQ